MRPITYAVDGGHRFKITGHELHHMGPPAKLSGEVLHQQQILHDDSCVCVWPLHCSSLRDDEPASGPIQETLLDNGPERDLYERFQSLRDEIASADYTAALEAIASIRPQVDTFFDKVMVNVPDEAVRTNRLKLLGSLLVEFSTIADFSEIVTQ